MLDGRRFRGAKVDMYKIILILLSCIVFPLFISCEKPIIIPFEVTNNRIVFDATINGKSGRFLFDTGAFLSQADCSFDNLQFLNSTSYALEGSSEMLSYYQLEEVIFNNSIVVKSKSKVSKISKALKDHILIPEKLDGKLGNNTFNGYWVKLSFSENKFFLYRNRPFIFLYKSTPVTFVNDNVVIKGKINSKDIPFIFDTGASTDFSFPDTLKNEINTENYNISSNSNKNIHILKIDNMTVLNSQYSNNWAITDGIGFKSTMDGCKISLGLNYLKSYDWIIDYTSIDRMKPTSLFYKPNNIQVEYTQTLSNVISSTGIVKALSSDSGILVLYIITNSQLNKKGIIPGTVIIEINGKPVKQYSKEQLSELIYYTKQNTIFTILSGNEKINIEFNQN